MKCSQGFNLNDAIAVAVCNDTLVQCASISWNVEGDPKLAKSQSRYHQAVHEQRCTECIEMLTHFSVALLANE